jgi:hypothetical protein
MSTTRAEPPTWKYNPKPRGEDTVESRDGSLDTDYDPLNDATDAYDPFDKD